MVIPIYEYNKTDSDNVLTDRESTVLVESLTEITKVEALKPAPTSIAVSQNVTPTLGGTVLERGVNDIDNTRGVALIVRGARYFETCSDATLQVFTAVKDRTVDEPFKSYVDAAAVYGLNAQMFSLVCLDNGDYLLGMGYADTYNATLWDNGNGHGAGELYLSQDGGQSWTSVLKMQYGYPPQHAWSGISGNRIAVGEYNALSSVVDQNPRNVYVSEDYGQTWETIYSPDPASSPFSHVHTCCWVSDTQLLVSVGDGALSELFMLTNNSGTWTKGSEIWNEQPTSLLYYGGHVYLGNDGSGVGCIARWNLSTGEILPVLYLPRSETSASIPYLYTVQGTVCLSMKVIGGIIYASINDYLSGDKTHGGVYISKDGLNWTCIYRVEAENGADNIGGELDGKIWVAARDGTITFDVPTSRTVEGFIAGKGTTNEVPALNGDTFGTGHGWTSSRDTIAQELTGGIHGDECLKITPLNTDTMSTKSPGLSTIGSLPAAQNDFTIASLWLRVDEGWPLDQDISVAFVSGSDFTYSSFNYVKPTTNWQKVVLVGQRTGATFTGDIQLWIRTGAAGSNSKSAYIDAVKIYNSTGTDRFMAFSPYTDSSVGDSEVITPLSGLTKSFSSSFVWCPRSGNKEWQTDVKIASWISSTGSYIDLYWQQSTSKLILTDGTTTAITTETYPFEFADSLAFCLTTDGTDSTLYITDPVNGSITLIATGVSLNDPPAVLVLGTDFSRSDYGVGVFGQIRGFDSVLSSADVETVFNSLGDLKPAASSGGFFIQGG